LTLSFEEGVFSKDFRNYVIRLGDIDANGKDISDVIIYDHTGSDKSKLSLLTADSGSMYTEKEDNLFIMELDKGEQFREMAEKSPDKTKHKYPLLRTKFNSWTKVFDMSDFEMEAQNFNITRKEHDLLNARQLSHTIDSFDHQIHVSTDKIAINFEDMLDVEEVESPSSEDKSELPENVKDAINKQADQVKRRNRNAIKSITEPATQYIEGDLRQYGSLLETFDTLSAKSIIKASKHRSNKRDGFIRENKTKSLNLTARKNRCILRYNQIYAWAFICIIFLFIGAPLGSIVRKGGYGYPLLIAIIFFMMFIIIDLMGDKLTTSNSIDPVIAGWLSNIVLGPVAIVITYLALRDSNFSFIKDKLIEVKVRLLGH
jgi:lipopolysaccharide export system permease protein